MSRKPCPLMPMPAISLVVAGIVLALLFLVLRIGPALGGDDPCRGFIDTSCCCTAGCCRDVGAGELELRADGYYVRATGVKVERVLASPDGSTILCDCNGGVRARCLYLKHLGQ